MVGAAYHQRVVPRREFREWVLREAPKTQLPARPSHRPHTLDESFEELALPALLQVGERAEARDGLFLSSCSQQRRTSGRVSPHCRRKLERYVPDVQTLLRATHADGRVVYLDQNARPLQRARAYIVIGDIVAYMIVDELRRDPDAALETCADGLALGRDLSMQSDRDTLYTIILAIEGPCQRAIRKSGAPQRERFARDVEIIRSGLPEHIDYVRRRAVRSALISNADEIPEADRVTLDGFELYFREIPDKSWTSMGRDMIRIPRLACIDAEYEYAEHLIGEAELFARCDDAYELTLTRFAVVSSTYFPVENRNVTERIDADYEKLIRLAQPPRP